MLNPREEILQATNNMHDHFKMLWWDFQFDLNHKPMHDRADIKRWVETVRKMKVACQEFLDLTNDESLQFILDNPTL